MKGPQHFNHKSYFQDGGMLLIFKFAKAKKQLAIWAPRTGVDPDTMKLWHTILTVCRHVRYVSNTDTHATHVRHLSDTFLKCPKKILIVSQHTQMTPFSNKEHDPIQKKSG